MKIPEACYSAGRIVIIGSRLLRCKKYHHHNNAKQADDLAHMFCHLILISNETMNGRAATAKKILWHASTFRIVNLNTCSQKELRYSGNQSTRPPAGYLPFATLFKRCNHGMWT